MDLDAIIALEVASHFSGHRHISFDLDPRRKALIEKLPSLTEEDLAHLDQKDSSCPICFTAFLAILASEEMALAMESPATSTEELGVTRLVDTCGHVFCRKDIVTWIQQHDSCPTCRQPVIKRLSTVNSTNSLSARFQQLEERMDSQNRRMDDLVRQMDGIAQARSLINNWTLDRIEESLMPMSPGIRGLETTDAQGENTPQTTRDAEDRDGFVGMYS